MLTCFQLTPAHMHLSVQDEEVFFEENPLSSPILEADPIVLKRAPAAILCSATKR